MNNDKYYEKLISEKQKEITVKLAQLRLKNKLSAQELSLRAGMSPSYIHRMENNAFMPSVEAIIKILDVCKCSLEEFFSKDPAQYNNDIELAKTFNSLSTEQKYALLQLLKII